VSDTDRFDQAAATWDQEDRRVRLAREVAGAIATRIALSGEMRALDFGCGTGLVTLELAPKVGAMAGADTSSGMLDVLAEKARSLGLRVHLIPLDDTGTGGLGGLYDLIVSSMTLHHIADAPALLQHFSRHLVPGGRVALADLDEEDGSFHEDATGVHHRGFSRADFQHWLAVAGFSGIHLETVAHSVKGGRDYPVFLATARRA
jgi:cyclopropane fatty-acyl-phospholipid synthase-like methyltransferase